MVVQETEIAKLEAGPEEQRLNATVYKQADANAYAKRVQAEARSPRTSAPPRRWPPQESKQRSMPAQELGGHRRTNGRRAKATRTTGEAEAAATRPRGDGGRLGDQGHGVAEAEGIKARGAALARTRTR